MDETEDQKVARLGRFLDQPHREDTDSRLSRENRYTKMGTLGRLSDLPVTLCKSCCVFVPDSAAYLDIHEQRFHGGF